MITRRVSGTYYYVTKVTEHYNFSGTSYSDNRETDYLYDVDRNWLMKEVLPDPDGENQGLPSPVYSYTYYNNGQLYTSTEPAPTDSMNDAVTTCTYYYNGLLDKTYIPDATGATASSSTTLFTEYTYDHQGRETSETDPISGYTDSNDYFIPALTTNYGYDNYGLTVETWTGNIYSMTTTNWNGQVVSTDGDQYYSYQYDDLGRLSTATNLENDATTTYNYDNAGNLLSVTDPLNNITTYVYDNRNRCTDVILPNPDTGEAGSDLVTHYTYYDDGSLDTVTDGNGNTTSYVYDNLGRVQSVTQPIPLDGGTQHPVTRYYYNHSGDLEMIADPDSNQNSDPSPGDAHTTSWTYDALHRAITENIFADYGERDYSYDNAGNIADYIDLNGHETKYTYDNLHQLTEEDWVDYNVPDTDYLIDYTYDGAGGIQQAWDAGSTYTFTRDSLGRATTIEATIAGLDPSIYLNQQYDNYGNRTQLSVSIGDPNNNGIPDFVNDYWYNDNHQVTSIHQYGQEGGNQVVDKYASFSYDADNRLTNTSFGPADDSDMLSIAYTYDCASRLTSEYFTGYWVVETDQSYAYYPQYDFTYDNGGRITQEHLTWTENTGTPPPPSDATTNYTYDHDNRLISESDTTQNYEYDLNGNRMYNGTGTGQNYTYDDNSDRIVTDSQGYSYTYDNEGNVTEKCNDTNKIDYTWDYRNRLASVTNYNKVEGEWVQISSGTYTYDPFNRLIGSQSGSQNGILIYDGQNIILVFQGSSSNNLTNSDLSERFFWGPGQDQILLKRI